MRQAQTGSGLGRRPQCTSENIIDGNYTINYIHSLSTLLSVMYVIYDTAYISCLNVKTFSCFDTFS